MKQDQELVLRELEALRKENEDLKRQLADHEKNMGRRDRQTGPEADAHFYTIAHDLKGTVDEIELYARFLEEDNAQNLNQESIGDLRSIRDICEKTREMIRQSIAYSKADKKTLNREVIDMEALILDSFSHIRRGIKDRTLTLETFALPRLIGDKLLIKQAVDNILSNCVKFTRDIPAGKISVYAREDADRVNYCFQDNGIGFDMRYASGVMDLFARAHDETDYDGDGIGLSIVLRTIQRSGGDLEIFGMVNRGCTLTVRFPKNLILTADHSQRSREKKKDRIIIGAISAETGDYSGIAPCRRMAYQLAVDEINRAGGIAGKQVELICRDFHSDVSAASEIAWELSEIEKVDLILGGQLSSAREEIRKVANKTKTLYFFEALYEGGVADHYTFCISAVPEQNLYPMLKYLMAEYGKKCYIITADYNYGILSAESAKHFIERQGGEVVAVEYFQRSKSNFEVTIDNIVDMKPDILLSFCVSNNQNHFYQQWYDGGLRTIPIVSTIGVGLSHLHRDFAPPTMAGTWYMCSYAEEMKTAAAKAFTEKIRAKHSREAVPYIEFDAETAYTAVYLYKNAVELAGTVNTEAVISALESGDVGFDGPGGMVTIRGADHHTIRDMKLMTVREDHRLEVVAEYSRLYSTYIETMLEQESGIRGGLKKCGLSSPNIQYSLMFHK